MFADVRGRGLAWAMEFSCNSLKNTDDDDVDPEKRREVNAELAKNVMNGLMRQKMVTAITGGNRNVVLLTPPLCFTVENAVEYVHLELMF